MYWQKWRAKNRPLKPRPSRERNCLGCGQTFIPPNGREQSCSRQCAALADPARIARIKAHRGTKPRTYHLRHRDRHGSAVDREWRTAVFQRDDYTCQDCGIVGGRIQAHHVQAFKSHPELRHVLDNGLTLCADCHKKTDTYGWANYWKNEIAAKRLSQEVLPLEVSHA